MLWEEGRPPQVVTEVTSESTRDEDLYDKFEIYRDQVQVAVVAYQVASGRRKPAGGGSHIPITLGLTPPRSPEVSAAASGWRQPPGVPHARTSARGVRNITFAEIRRRWEG